MHVVLPVPLPPLILTHTQRILNGLSHVSDVPGVDEDGACEGWLGGKGVVSRDMVHTYLP